MLSSRSSQISSYVIHIGSRKKKKLSGNNSNSYDILDTPAINFKYIMLLNPFTVKNISFPILRKNTIIRLGLKATNSKSHDQ